MNKRNLLPMTKMKMLLTVLLFTMSKVLFAQISYCIPGTAGGCSFGDQYASFSTTGGITNINHNPGSTCLGGNTAGHEGYASFCGTNQSISATPGSFINFSITNNPTYPQGYAIWVDWNQDYVFDPSEEVYASSTVVNTSTTVTGSFTVPATAVGGSLTLRIRCHYNSAGTTIDPCVAGNTYDYGISFDFPFYVIVGGNNPPAFTNCNPQLTLCQDAPATDVTSLLHVSDVDAAQTETWSQAAAPSHGTLNFSSATAASGSTDITPGGAITYTPNPGYSGTDTFSVQVNDGQATTNKLVTVTVKPLPTPNVVATTDQALCNNAATTAVTFSGSVSGTTFNWTNNTTSIGIAANGSGDIASFTATNTGTTPVIATIIVTPTAATCNGTNDTFTITVNPTPTVNTVSNASYCSNIATSAINFSGAVAGTVYSWTNDNTNINLAANGTGNIASFTATNNTTAGMTGNLTVTPSYTNNAVTCTGSPTSFSIDVIPVPSVSPTGDQVVCNNGTTADVIFNGSIFGSAFNWTNSIASIGIPATGNGNILSFTATNTGTSPATANIIVTPAFTYNGNTCNGTKDTFTIQVNPTPTVNAIANQHTCPNTASLPINFTGAVAGTVYTWTNDNMLIGLVNNGVGNIPSFTATNTDTVSIYGTIVVTPTYTNSGVTCTGTTRTFYDTVNSTPFVYIDPLDSAFCLGTPATFSVRANGTGLTYRWQQNTGSGFANLSNGSIYSGVLTNTLTLNNIPITVNGYQYRCVVSGTCTPPDTSNAATLTVATPPSITQLSVNQTICTGGSTSFTTAATGYQLTYQWSVNTGSGFTPIGDTGVYFGTHTPTLTLTNVPAFMNGYQYQCAVSGKCSPNVNSNAVVLTVYPNPVLTSPSPSQALCNNAPLNYIPTSNVSGTTFAWTRQFNPDISTPLTSGAGNIHDTLTNTSPLPVNVTYIYTLTANGCTNPTTYNVIVTINPTPVLSSSLIPPAVCSNTPFDYIPTSQTPGTKFSWSRATVAGITNSAASDTAAIHEVLVNTTPYPILVHYTYHTIANSCIDTTTYDVQLTVKPMPRLSSPLAAGTTCSDAQFTYTATTATPNTTFQWNRASFTGLFNPADSGFTNIAQETLIDTLAIPVNVTYVYTLAADGCVNNTNYVSVTLAPSPRLLSDLAPVICSNTAFNYTPVSTLSGTIFHWSRAAVTGIANPANTGNGTINEVLVNTTPNPIDVVYAYTMISNGCSFTQNVVVTVKPLPTLSSGTTSLPACSGTLFTYTPAIATTGATYIWTRNQIAGITNAAATGTADINEVLSNTTASPITVPYIFNMVANGCANTQTLNVVVNPLLVPTATVVINPNPTVCVNTPVTATVTTNITGGTYAWNLNSINVSLNSSYSYMPTWGDVIHCTVTAPAGSCFTANSITTGDVTITVNPYDSSYVLISGNTNVLAGTPCTYVATTNMIGGTYQWKVNGVNVGTSSNTYSYIPNNGDQITCTVAAANFTCYTPNVNTSNIIAVLVTVDVKGTTSMHNIRVYPNPAKNILHIDNLSTATHFKLINVVGVTVQDGSLQSGDNFINIDEIASGIYILELTNNINEKAMIKVIKE